MVQNVFQNNVMVNLARNGHEALQQVQLNLNQLMKYERKIFKKHATVDQDFNTGNMNVAPHRTSSLSRILLASSKSSIPETPEMISKQETPQAYSLIILDLNMPIMNGYDAC